MVEVWVRCGSSIKRVAPGPCPHYEGTMLAATKPDLIVNDPAKAAVTLVLAHGAGAAMDSPFMNKIAERVAGTDLRVVRFEFPYMALRRTTGRRGAPDREPILLESWRSVIASLGDPSHTVIGGKSLGGRIASMVADDANVAGLVCLGYPFHPPGNPDRVRIAHLEKLRTPTLILQGTHDAFGRPEEVARYPLAPGIRIEWVEDADHSLKPRASSGRTEDQVLAWVAEQIRGFVNKLELIR